MSKKLKVPLGLLALATDPSLASAGDIYFNTVLKNIKVYDGENWIELLKNETLPFFMHTHDYDGNVVEPVEFDGGSPTSVFENPAYPTLENMDGGTVEQ